MTSGILLAVASIAAAVAEYGRRKWQSPTPVRIDDWSRLWGVWAISAVVLAASAISTCAAGAP